LARGYLAEDGPGREALYYRTRAARPRSDLDVVARLIFLNRTCFNGLYRVNRSGGFNVPHGRYRDPAIAQPGRLRAASKALRGVELLCVDFEEACDGAGPDDFVYFDPPFYPLSDSASFTAYTDEDFGAADQLRLKACIDALTRRGASVLLSDSGHPWIEGLYRGGGYGVGDGAIELVPARRAINSRGDRRGAIGELLIANYRASGGHSSNGFRRDGAQLALLEG
jgi:DNA adenine methylase